jgi:ClpP class serine protease
MRYTRSLIRSIAHGMWAIHPEFAMAYAPQIKAILSGEKMDLENVSPDNTVIVSYFDDDEDGEVEETIEGNLISQIDVPGSVVVIPICGPILKHDSWCEVGMQTRAEQLRQAYANDNVSGVVLFGDTPGGESQACSVMTKAIEERNKPVIGFVDGMLCSAGVYIFAGCDEIYASSKDAIIGSIGTMISFADSRGMWEKEGVKFHEIYADASTDKNKEFRDALQGEYQTMKDTLLNPMNKLFIDHVKSSRPNLNHETTLSGKIFLSEAAKANGLIEDVTDLDFAIKQVNMLFNSKFKKLESFSGKKNLTRAEAAEMQKILNGLGIPAAVRPKSQLLETEGDSPAIYVYAEEGEDPVGKRCVEADAEGNPTETNLQDGDHDLADGRVLTSSTKEDGLSYVDSISEAEAEESGEGISEDDDDKKDEDEDKPNSKNKVATVPLSEVDKIVQQKLDAFKASLSLGKTPKQGGNGGQLRSTKDMEYEKSRHESPFERRRREILEKNKRK